MGGGVGAGWSMGRRKQLPDRLLEFEPDFARNGICEVLVYYCKTSLCSFLYSTGWPQTCYINEEDLERLILLLPPPESWEC